MNEQDDPKHKPAAAKIAKAFKSKPLSWRLQDDDKTLVVVLVSGPKVDGDTQGNPNKSLLAQLFPPKDKTADDELADERETALSEKEKELAAREAALEAREKALAKKQPVKTTEETPATEGEINLTDGVSADEASLAGKALQGKKATATKTKE